MTQDELKQAVAKAAVDHIAPHLEPSSIVGVGTGSTANFFIDYLAEKGKEERHAERNAAISVGGSV